jgi:hypothetical protein
VLYHTCVAIGSVKITVQALHSNDFFFRASSLQHCPVSIVIEHMLHWKVVTLRQVEF